MGIMAILKSSLLFHESLKQKKLVVSVCMQPDLLSRTSLRTRSQQAWSNKGKGTLEAHTGLNFYQCIELAAFSGLSVYAVVMHLHCAWLWWLVEGRVRPPALTLCRQPVDSCNLPRWPHFLKPLKQVSFLSHSSVCQPNSIKHDVKCRPAIQEGQMCFEIMCFSFLLSVPFPVIFQTISVP